MGMKILQSVIAAMLITVLTINVIAMGFNLALSITILRPKFYDRVFQQAQFYGQVRQWLFSRVNAELPNGHEALPYLEKAMTEDWLRDEVLALGQSLLMFLNGKTDQLPVIPVYKLFDRLDDYMTPAQLENRDKVINYWFGPIPERVRFQDILSVELFWVLRQLVMYYKYISWGMAGVFLILAGLLAAVVRGLKRSLVWMGASTAAAGGLMLELSLAIRWILSGNDMISRLSSEIAFLNFPSHAIELLIMSCAEHFLAKIDMIAFLLLLTGACLITFCGFDRKLVLIK